MPEDQLRSAFEGIRARLEDELEALRRAFDAQQSSALAEARRLAEADVESKWRARLDALRAETTAAAARARDEHERERLQFETALHEARARAVSEAAGERDRARELQQAREEIASLTQAREQAEAALQAEVARRDAHGERDHEREQAREEIAALTQARDQAHATLQAERERAATEIEAARQRAVALAHARDQVQASLSAERDQAVQKATVLAETQAATAVTSARAEERQAQLLVMERLLEAVKMIDAARTLSDALTALATAAASHAPRTAVFIINRDQLQPWKSAGFDDLHSQTLSAADDSVLARAIRSAEPSSTTAAPPPGFAGLASGRAALAVPITVGGQPVAVLYADDGGAPETEAPATWHEAVQVLGRHASVCLAHLTAVRTAQAARFSRSASPATARPPAGGSEEESSARRYARLLVSEIKLYNESAVRVGRERRDLLTRLGAEIERAQRLYEERVPSSIGARSEYFQQELVQTLADGDPGLLGGLPGSQ